MRPPKDIKGDALVKWKEMLAPEVWGRVVTEADRDVLAEYCRLAVRKEKAEAMVAEHGELVASPNGFPVQSPWMQIVNKCRADMMKIAAAFGGTPAARKASEASAPEGKKAQRQANAEQAASGGRFAVPSAPKLVVNNGK